MRRATAASERSAAAHGEVLLQLPEDPARGVACAASWRDVDSAVRRGAAVVVLLPGKYTTMSVLEPGPRNAPFALLGLGDVELRPAFGAHVVWLDAEGMSASIFHVRLVGGGTRAAACVSAAGSQLQLVGCRVEDYRWGAPPLHPRGCGRNRFASGPYPAQCCLQVTNHIT